MNTELQRLTIRYSETEDRIRLAGELQQGGTVVIWLTRRLLRRLIPVVSGWLEQKEMGALSAAAMQEFAQHAARAGLAPQAPVEVTAESRSWLAHKVDVAKHPEALGLLWQSIDGDQANLILEATPLRQWLNIMHDTYVLAQWTLEEWPAWLTADGQATMPPAASIH